MHTAALEEIEHACHSDISGRRPFVMRDDGRVSPDNAKIRCLRKQRGYSQEYVAGMTGLNIKTIHNLESKTNGRCKLATLKALAIFFDVEVRMLINAEGNLSIPDTYVLRVLPRHVYLMKRPLEVEQDFACPGLIKPAEYVAQE